MDLSSDLFTVTGLNAGCAGLVGCGHRHSCRPRAEKCLRALSQFRPSVLCENGTRVKAMFQGVEFPVQRYTELEADRGPEGRVRWVEGMGV